MLSGIGEYGGFQNSYRIDIPQVDTQTVREQDEKKASQETGISLVNPYHRPLEEDNRSTVANLEDVSLTFNKGESYDYIGTNSSLANLDMEEAISDMQKDRVLDQYKFFVGSNDKFAQVLGNEDGMVFVK